MTHRLALPNRRNHTTQKVHIGGHRSIHISVHDQRLEDRDLFTAEGQWLSSELSCLYNVVARLMSIVVQFGASA